MRALQAATGAVDFLAGRSGGERSAEFLRHGEELVAVLRRLGPALADFVQRETVGAPVVARLVWMDLVVESGSLRKRVRQAAHWLAEMDHDLLRGAGVPTRRSPCWRSTNSRAAAPACTSACRPCTACARRHARCTR